MKVLHLTDDLSGLSGVRSYLLALREVMEPLGIRCDLSSQGKPGGPLRTHLSRWFSLRHRSLMAASLRRDRPDVVHAHNLWMRLSPAPLAAARRAGIPVVMTVHDYHLVCPRKWMITGTDQPCAVGFGATCLHSNCRGEPEGWPSLPYNDLRWLKVAGHRAMLRRWVDLFIAPSEHLATWLRKSLAVDNVIAIPNFAPPPPTPVHDRRDGGERILFAGRLSREKGVDVLLEAMPAVLAARPEAALDVVGDGKDRHQLEARAERLGLTGRVRFLGVRSGAELSEVLSAARVFVLPTLWMENCPVSVLEAMAHSLPVVATGIGGVPELVREGETGLLFDRGDHDQLARAIVTLLADPSTATAFGERAAELYRESFSPEVHARRLTDVYRSFGHERT